MEKIMNVVYAFSDKNGCLKQLCTQVPRLSIFCHLEAPAEADPSGNISCFHHDDDAIFPSVRPTLSPR